MSGVTEVIERLENFKSRRREPRVWQGDEDALKAFAYIESTGFKSPRKQNEAKSMKVADRLKFFDEKRNFGFTKNGVFIHRDDIVKGDPVEGAYVEYDVEETPRGLRGINVTVK